MTPIQSLGFLRNSVRYFEYLSHSYILNKLVSPKHAHPDRLQTHIYTQHKLKSKMNIKIRNVKRNAP